MIQAGGDKVIEELHAICNQIWKEGRIPEEWTKSVIITLPKKGDLSQCSNYRTVALLSHVGKVLMMVLLERLKAQMEIHLSEEQAGFRRDRSTVHQILILRLIAEKAKRKGRHIINCFIDFQKAFVLIKHDIIWATFRSYGVGTRLVEILQIVSERATSVVRVGGELIQNHGWYTTRRSDIANNFHLVSRESDGHNKGKRNWDLSTSQYKINYLKFADDIDLLAEDRNELQENLERIYKAGETAGLKINIQKTMTVWTGEHHRGID
jgi:Reverse transcriptase (RNA-dependent DNA polymerase)